VFAALLIATRRHAPLVYALLGSLFLLLAGLVGVAMLMLWTLTTHHSAWANANLLLFNPLAFLLLRLVWRSRDSAPTRLSNIILLLQLIATLIALLMHALPSVTQQNQPWILFALPCWLGLAWSLRQSGQISIRP